MSTSSPPWGARFKQRVRGVSLGFILAVLAAVLAIYPLVMIVLKVLAPEGVFDLGPVFATLAAPTLPPILLNTFILMVASGVCGTLIGGLLAWFNERTDARMGVVTDAMPLVPFLVPPIAGAIGWVVLLSPRAGMLNVLIRDALAFVGIHLEEGPFDIGTWGGLIFVMTLYQVPYVFLLVSAGLRSMDPALEEQSRMSGAGLFRTLRRVTLPALGPSFGAASLLLVWTAVTMFAVPYIVGGQAKIQVVSVEIVEMVKGRYPADIAGALTLGSILVLFVLCIAYFQRRLLASRKFSTTGGKGHRITRVELGPWKILVRAGMLLYVALASVIPLIGLALVALQGYWNPNIRWDALNPGVLIDAVFGDRRTFGALTNSLTLGVVGGLVGMILAVFIARYVLANRSSLSRVLDSAIKVPLVVSHTVIAIGFLLAFAGAPFWLTGTWFLLFLAYLMMYLPQGSIIADTAMGQIGKELPEASRMSGAGDLYTLRRIEIPLALGGLAVGWAMLFVHMVGDISASVILAGPRNDVVGFRIMEIWENGTWGALCALALVLTLISAATVLAVLVVSKRATRLTGRTRRSGNRSPEGANR